MWESPEYVDNFGIEIERVDATCQCRRTHCFKTLDAWDVLNGFVGCGVGREDSVLIGLKRKPEDMAAQGQAEKDE